MVLINLCFFSHRIGSLINSMFASSIPLKLPVIIGTNLRIILSHNNRLSTTKIILKGSWKNLSVSTYLILCGRRYWTAVVIAFNEIFEPFYVCCENKHFFLHFQKNFLPWKETSLRNTAEVRFGASKTWYIKYKANELLFLQTVEIPGTVSDINIRIYAIIKC